MSSAVFTLVSKNIFSIQEIPRDTKKYLEIRGAINDDAPYLLLSLKSTYQLTQVVIGEVKK